ncbi:flagellar basal body rod protein FlgC [Bradyrhizobium sp.]|uniref:flagellar basal body rod protein FlgC n=1 Tax=Bradyrhizobium sp. TaxID=376 RepID=UPI0025C3D53E|nr:flagellar basal body rod protein FlgC [Bradyrhizobium sp.]MCA3569241.1 flagellar basal body rod protein FlgC [Bradyrhizobium sp.]
MDLASTIDISASGLRAQSLRMRIIAENLANQDSIAATPGGTPYTRKIVTFRPVVDAKSGATTVAASRIVNAASQFRREYRPGNPAADAQGYILLPNVNGLVESADMQSAQRSYEANLNVIEAARSLTTRTLDLLR